MFMPIIRTHEPQTVTHAHPHVFQFNVVPHDNVVLSQRMTLPQVPVTEERGGKVFGEFHVPIVMRLTLE